MKKFIASLGLIAVLALCCMLGAPAPQVHAQQYAVCIAASASPVNCQSSSSGIVYIAAAASSAVVNTTAVNANSRILLTYDASTVTGTALGVTCNTTAQLPYVSARSVGLSFTIATGSTFTTNPGCIQFHIIQ